MEVELVWAQTVGLALALGIGVAATLLQRRGTVARSTLWAGTLAALGGGALGARLWHGWVALVRPGSAMARLAALSQSELSALGALGGGALALAAWALVQRQPGWRVADRLAPGLLLGAAVVWLTGHLTGSVYGVAWYGGGAIASLDASGLLVPRWPVALVGAGTCALVGGALWRWQARRPPPPGVLALLALWTLGLLGVGVGVMRDDPARLIGPLRGDQVAALGVVALAGLALPWRWRRGAADETKQKDPSG